MNKLKGMRTYLCGSIDRAPDGGVEWRDWITPKLQEFNLGVMNPCKKPIDIGGEDLEDRDYRKKLLKEKKYDELSKYMRTIRVVDLRMSDVSDFAIVNFDTDARMMGTIEEMTVLNSQKKPILLYCPRGIDQIYAWVWGMIPYQMYFEQWDDLFSYLKDIDDGTNTEYLNRWTWIDYERILPPQLKAIK